jgi:hypothetical protein
VISFITGRGEVEKFTMTTVRGEAQVKWKYIFKWNVFLNMYAETNILKNVTALFTQ